jgi:hypothetical protein
MGLVLGLLASYSCAQEPNQVWVLEQATLTYHMSHPMHEVDGASHAAKGKGVCQAETCEFLVAAPVKSFDSGDTNRNLHMLQAARGAEFPLVTVRFHLSDSQVKASTFDCDLAVEFAGQTAHYSHVQFHQDVRGSEHHIRGVIPATLTDFKIPPPSFLMVPVKNEIPVTVDASWHEQ